MLVPARCQEADLLACPFPSSTNGTHRPYRKHCAEEQLGVRGKSHGDDMRRSYGQGDGNEVGRVHGHGGCIEIMWAREESATVGAANGVHSERAVFT